MGIDLDLAVGQVDEEFVCSICKDILENPVEIKGCVHLFCDECIRGALQERDYNEKNIIHVFGISVNTLVINTSMKFFDPL